MIVSAYNSRDSMKNALFCHTNKDGRRFVGSADL